MVGQLEPDVCAAAHNRRDLPGMAGGARYVCSVCTKPSLHAMVGQVEPDETKLGPARSHPAKSPPEETELGPVWSHTAETPPEETELGPVWSHPAAYAIVRIPWVRLA